MEIFAELLTLHKEHKDLIDFIKDVVFFTGAYYLIKAAWLFFRYVKNRRYKEKSKEIDHNINFRERLEPLLNEYIFDAAKGTMDISIRFVHWKNYPRQLEQDGYKFLLRINYIGNGAKEMPHYGWLDNTGVNFENPIWFYSNSLYVDKDGWFFIGEEGKEHKGFTEISDSVLVLHLPFSNIINYDFREKIDYEPVFYIKYEHSDFDNLYSNEIILREKQGTEYKRLILSKHKRIAKFSKCKYYYKKTLCFFIGLSFMKWVFSHTVRV